MKKHLSQQAYFWLEYIGAISEEYSKFFGDVWWYSLVQEKNIFKSMSFHNFFKNNKPNNRFVRIKSVLKGVKKYLSFIYRYLNKPIREVNFKNKLIVSYGESHLRLLEEKNDSTIIVIPTKNNYNRLIVDDKYRLVDEWLTLKDFFIVLVKYFQILYKFVFKMGFWADIKEYKTEYISVLRRLCDCILEDWWRSFAGDVLIEGLFYEHMFKNLRKQSENVREVFYVFEGLAWEKALCIAFKDKKKYGVLQSVVGQNTLHYYCDKLELDIMPLPDGIGVYGDISKEVMQEFYGDKVFIVGDLRGNIKNKLTNFKKDDIVKLKTVVVLGPVKRMNQELIKWAKANREYFMIKLHSDDKSIYDGYEIVKDFYSELNSINEVIGCSSTLLIEAAAIGIKTTVPELQSFIDMNLIGLDESLERHFSANILS